MVETQAKNEVTSVDQCRPSMVPMRDIAFPSSPCGPPGQAVQPVKLLTRIRYPALLESSEPDPRVLKLGLTFIISCSVDGVLPTNNRPAFCFVFFSDICNPLGSLLICHSFAASVAN